MFKGRIVSRSNINGKVHSFQKDFDDYDTYQEFIDANPEYAPATFLENIWSPWGGWSPWGLLNQVEPLMLRDTAYALPTNTKYLPEGLDLSKYEKRRIEKRQSEAEKTQRKYTLERSKEYLEDYMKENPDDADAQGDMEKLEKELKSLG